MTDELRGRTQEVAIIDDGAFKKDQPVRIRCCICAHEEKGRCAKKKSKVNVNKSRRCAEFILEAEKVPVKRKAKGTYIPFHMRDAKAYKAHIKKRSKEVQEQQSMQAKLDALKSPDCLAQFRSSAED